MLIDLFAANCRAIGAILLRLYMDLESSKLFIYICNVLLDDKCKLLEATYEYTSILLREGGGVVGAGRTLISTGRSSKSVLRLATGKTVLA